MSRTSDITRTFLLHCPDCGRDYPLTVTCDPELMILQDGYRILCTPCGNARRVAEQRRREAEATQRKINATGIPPQFRVFDRTRGNLAMLDWISANTDRNILLMSEVNTGKTRAMCKSLLDVQKCGLLVHYIDFVDLSGKYSGAKKESTTEAQRLLKRILHNHDIVMLDDLDKQRLTDTTGELLYKIFNAVYSGTARCRIWATMNHNGVELMKRFENADQGAAVLSRIERMKKDDRFAVKHF